MTNTHTAAYKGHIDALLSKHSTLSKRIDEEIKHPSTDGFVLRQLKAQKLRLKDEIEQERRRA